MKLVNKISILNEMGDLEFKEETYIAENFELYFTPNEKNIQKVINIINILKATREQRLIPDVT